MDKMLEDLVELASFPGPILSFSISLFCRAYIENIGEYEARVIHNIQSAMCTILESLHFM